MDRLQVEWLMPEYYSEVSFLNILWRHCRYAGIDAPLWDNIRVAAEWMHERFTTVHRLMGADTVIYVFHN